MSEMLPDIPRIFTAIAEWLACLLQISFLRKRFKRWQLTMIATSWLMIQSLFFVITDNVPISMWLLCMLVAIALMLLFLFICCKEGIVELVCACTKAFLLAELVASFEWQIHCFLMSYSIPQRYFKVPLFVVLYVLLFYLVYLLEKKLNQGANKRKKSVSEMWWMLLIGGTSFLFSNISFTSIVSPFSGKVVFDNFYIRTLVNIGGVAILYAYQGYLNELFTLNELANIDNLYKRQYENYMRFQESMDVINIKHHDLKHQINILRSENGTQKWMELLDTMEREIDENNISLNTGSSVLDTILSEKMLFCKKEKINLTCMIDGSLLHFMQVADICSIFGNALDNAIESVRLIEDENKRLIHVDVRLNCGCVYILIRNYTENNIQLEQNIFSLESTKPDKAYHGYGLKSIQRTVKKYGGTCSIKMEDGWFVLRILLETELKESM